MQGGRSAVLLPAQRLEAVTTDLPPEPPIWTIVAENCLAERADRVETRTTNHFVNVHDEKEHKLSRFEICFISERISLK